MTGTSGVLAGITVVDFSELLPGPNATRTLAALGADVIKVERPGGGDRMRHRPEMFEAENRGKRSVTLNLKDPDDINRARALVRDADVLVEGYRPGVMARLGLGFDEARELNPAIIYVSISGYGADGPYRDLPGHDFQYLSFAGAIPAPGVDFADRYVPTSLPVADMGSALYGVLGVVLAILEKVREPAAFAGRFLDVAMADVALALMEPRIAEAMAQPGDSSEALNRPGYGVYATKDGGFVTIGAIEDHFFAALVGALQVPELIGPDYSTFQRRRQRTERIERVLRDRVATFERDDLIRLLTANDVPVAPVNALHEPANDPHFRARGMVYEDADGTTRIAEWPRVLDSFASRDRLTTAPKLGAHNVQVLTGTQTKPVAAQDEASHPIQEQAS